MADQLFAYVGKNLESGFGLDRIHGTRYELINCNGERIGTCALVSSWPVKSFIGTRMFQIYAWANGREYTGRGFGEGMVVRLKETARSRKSPKGIDANGLEIK